jgi:hypothetical protein
MVPSEMKTTAFGFFSGAALFGGALSPSTAGFVAHWHFFGIYWIDAALFAAIALALAVGPSRKADP